jgi:hypothetical protein
MYELNLNSHYFTSTKSIVNIKNYIKEIIVCIFFLGCRCEQAIAPQ